MESWKSYSNMIILLSVATFKGTQPNPTTTPLQLECGIPYYSAWQDDWDNDDVDLEIVFQEPQREMERVSRLVSSAAAPTILGRFSSTGLNITAEAQTINEAEKGCKNCKILRVKMPSFGGRYFCSFTYSKLGNMRISNYSVYLDSAFFKKSQIKSNGTLIVNNTVPLHGHGDKSTIGRRDTCNGTMTEHNNIGTFQGHGDKSTTVRSNTNGIEYYIYGIFGLVLLCSVLLCALACFPRVLHYFHQKCYEKCRSLSQRFCKKCRNGQGNNRQEVEMQGTQDNRQAGHGQNNPTDNRHQDKDTVDIHSSLGVVTHDTSSDSVETDPLTETDSQSQ